MGRKRHAAAAAALSVLLLPASCDVFESIFGGTGTGGIGVSSSITGNVTRTKGSTDHVTTDVTVSGSLTIQPGVTVSIDSTCDIGIATGATFSAVGTASQPITFTSSAASYGAIDASHAASGTVISNDTFTGNGSDGTNSWDLYIGGNTNVTNAGNTATYINP